MSGADAAVARAKPSRTLGILALGALAYALAQTMIIPALPAIQDSLHTSEATATWLLTIFLLTSSVATPLLGRLGDMYGKERILLVSLAVFGLGSLICAIGGSIEVLIFGRAVQGAGGAIFPLAFGIIRDEFPRERVASSIGSISSTYGIGGGGGLVLAGLLVDHLSVPWIFWTSLAATTFAAWATWRFVPESPVRAKARIDWGGGALMSITLLALLLAIAQGSSWGWTSGRVLGLFAASTVFFAWFVLYELRIPEPVVDMRLMATRPMWSTNIASFAVGFAMFGSYILIPQLIEMDGKTGFGFGRSTTAAGLVMLPSALVMLFAGPWAGWLGTKFGSRLPLALGSVATAVGYAALAVAHGALWEIAAGAAVMGIGIALALAAMGNLVVQAVRPEQTGVATGINVITRSIGGAVGAQIAASLLASQTILGGEFPAERAFTQSFAMSSVAALVGLACCALIPLARPLRASRDLAAA